MRPHLPFIIMLLIGPLVILYGWWSLFRTESAMNFLRNRFIGDRGNWVITKIHGVVFFVVGSGVVLAGILHFLNPSLD